MVRVVVVRVFVVVVVAVLETVAVVLVTVDDVGGGTLKSFIAAMYLCVRRTI